MMALHCQTGFTTALNCLLISSTTKVTLALVGYQNCGGIWRLLVGVEKHFSACNIEKLGVGLETRLGVYKCIGVVVCTTSSC